MASIALAGERVHASSAWLDAATTYTTPDAIDLATEVFVVPLRLMLATAGFTALAVTQSTPAMSAANVPFAEQSSTRTCTRVTPLALPWRAPPRMPTTCVPCPLQSSVPVPPIASNPLPTRPPSSSCVLRTPVSRTCPCTPAPTLGNVYFAFIGREGWLTRSSPHTAFG
nr:hypothetical protein [Lentzea atacamensis]